MNIDCKYLCRRIVLCVRRRTVDVNVFLLCFQCGISYMPTDFTRFQMWSDQILNFSVAQLLLVFGQLVFRKNVIVVLRSALWRTFWFIAAVGFGIGPKKSQRKITISGSVETTTGQMQWIQTVITWLKRYSQQWTRYLLSKGFENFSIRSVNAHTSCL